MYPGNRYSKLDSGVQKLPEKNQPSRFPNKSKKLPEKTKFTLQYDSAINKSSSKCFDRRFTKIVGANDTELQKTVKSDIGSSGTSWVPATTPDIKKTAKAQLRKPNEERKVRSTADCIPYIVSSAKMVKSSSVTYNKVAIVKKTTRCPATRKSPAEPKSVGASSGLDRRGSETVKSYQCKSRSKIEIKTNRMKTTTLKKSTTYQPVTRIAANAEVGVRCRKSCACCKDLTDNQCGHDTKSQPLPCKNRTEGDIRKPEVPSGETHLRSIIDPNVEGVLGEDPEMGRNRTIQVHNLTLQVTKQKVADGKPKLNITKENLGPSTEVFADQDMESGVTLNIFPGTTESEVESTGKRAPNCEIFSIDKRIWSDLEVQIRETCEKTDFLYHSGDESVESLTNIIEQLLVPLEQTESSTTRSDNSGGAPSDRDVDQPTAGPEEPTEEKEGSPRLSGELAKPADCNSDFSARETAEDPEERKSAFRPKMKIEEPELRSANVESTLMDHMVSATPQQREANPEAEKGNRSTPAAGFFKSHENVAFIGKSIDEGFVSFELGDVTLYQPAESQMLLYDLANCVATQGYLKVCGINFKTEFRKNAAEMSPSGRVPFVCSGLCIIPEFEAIVSFMQYKTVTSSCIQDSDKSDFQAILSALANTLEMSERYICWFEEATLIKYTKPRIRSQYPFPLNHIMHWKKKFHERRIVSEHGMTGKSFDMILREINSCFRNLSKRLGDRNFFFGNISTELDALAYGHIYALFSVDVEGPFRDIQFIIHQFPNLMAFADRFDKRFGLGRFPPLDFTYWDNVAGIGSDISFCAKVSS